MDFSRHVLVNKPRRLLVLRHRTSGWADLGSPAWVVATLTRNGIQPEWVREADVASYTSISSLCKKRFLPLTTVDRSF
jgi:hypothetical protein